MNTFESSVQKFHPEGLFSSGINVIQVNVGLRCNQQCVHCHVAAGPGRKEEISWENMEKIQKLSMSLNCQLVDITGGAPEMHPHFEKFISGLCEKGLTVQVRTNLTILLEDGYKHLPDFYRDHGVLLVASLPCYLEENVDQQRGAGVYHKSINAIKILNEHGYGIEKSLPLSLVYNPPGPVLPPHQSTLEKEYRAELKRRFGLSFTRLYVLSNMPIGRFMATLRHQNKDHEYMKLLRDSFNPATLDGLMCRHQLSINWDGTLFDCDFNLALKQPVNHGLGSHIDNFDIHKFSKRKIVTGEHCFGCTAGCGSSCGGAIAGG